MSNKMRLLVITQKVDKNDPVLGFFHNWIFKLSGRFENIIVVCLSKGEYNLPSNVKVFSLGKEKQNESRIMNYELWIRKFGYLLNFYRYIWKTRNDYDKIFVHMNQEYVLLGGIFWKVFGKRVYLWRNHQYGNLATRIAVWLSDKVFCTSSQSFTARFKKTEMMPVGVDANQFQTAKIPNAVRNKILFLGRISPVKNVHIFIAALKIIKKRGIEFNADIIGDPVNPEDFNYQKKLISESVDLIESKNLNFMPAVPNYKTSQVYQSHKIFVNLTASGSFDKTIVEAALCGCLLIISNKFLIGKINGNMIVRELTPENVAEKILFWLNMDDESNRKNSMELREYMLLSHSLDALIQKLFTYIK